MNKKKMLGAGAALVVVLLAAGVYFDYTGEKNPGHAAGTAAVAQSNEDPTKSPLEGKTAPKITAQTMDGKTVTIDGANDNTIYVLNFWASWCPPCRAELPEIQKFAEAQHENVKFYSINMQESPEKIQSFMKQNGYDFPVLLDPQNKAGSDYFVKYIPITLIIDSKGIVRYQQVGGTTQVKLEAEIAKLKAEAK